MAYTVPSTPLLAIDGVVLDTETTGLDPKVARLVQVGAVRITGASADFERPFDQLVNPGIAIPKASTVIHGISDADVRDAPDAAQAIAAFDRFRDGAAIVGHTIAFDIAVIGADAGRAGIAWNPPPALDVRLLARIAIPELADESLEALCDRYGIEIEGRHTALGDAAATARVFAALLGPLRGRSIRTLAEAETACRAMVDREARQNGVPPAVEAPSAARDERRMLARVDSYPYTHRVRDVMSAPPVELAPETRLEEALIALIDKGVSSVFVPMAVGGMGIVTERDVLRVLHANRAGALAVPLADIATAPLQSVSQDAFVYRAIGRMDRLGIRHLGVHDASGAIVGAVTTRNLLRHRATAAMVLGDAISAADGEAALGKAWAGLPGMAQRLSEENIDPLMSAAVVSSEIRALTRRAAEIAEARLIADGRGGAPVPYAVLVLGSAGRGESLLAADQDNAIVYHEGEPGGPEDAWFEALGTHVADILDGVGVPYCTGGVMAKNAAWRQNLDGWKTTVERWVGTARPEDLLSVDIFFDAVPVYGVRELGETVIAHAYELAGRAPAFRRALAEQMHDWQRPTGWFGGIRTGAGGRIDLKLHGLLPIFTAARILAIRAGIMARATPERLRGAAEAGQASHDQVERLIESERVIIGAMLKQQIADTHAGVPLGPKVDPEILGKAGKAQLKEALGRVGGAVDLAREGVL